MLPTLSPPSYRLHKPTGLGVVRLNGKDFYLGKYDTPESRARYDRQIGEWLSNNRQLSAAQATPADGSTTGGITVKELVAAYWGHAKGYYLKDEKPTSELGALRHAFRPLMAQYGGEPAADFGPLKLKALRESMVALGWARSTINKHVQRIVRLFRWCVENEKIPANIHHALSAVEGLKRGRTTAKEPARVLPVPQATVAQTIPHVCPEVAAMIQVQLLTGMRPGEVCIMRSCDIEMKGEAWTYRPSAHKTEHHGQDRIVKIGPKAQEIIRPYLGTNLQRFLFSPAAAMQARAGRKRKSRARGAERLRGPGERYTVESYRRAIARACDDAFPLPPALEKLNAQVAEWRRLLWKTHKRPAKRNEMPAEMIEALAKLEAHRAPLRWHPHQLRHTAATVLRSRFGSEAAQGILGHKNLSTTEIYAERDLAAAARIMAEVG